MSTVNLSKQTVNLSKNQVVNLSKQSNGLGKVMVGLGWDEANKNTGGFFSKLFGGNTRGTSNYNFDLDAWVVPFESGKRPSLEDIVYFGRLDKFENGKNVIHHCGDNLTGKGDGDDEQIIIDLSSLPNKYTSVLIGITIYKGDVKNQTFGDIKNVFVRTVDMKDNFEMCRYEGLDIDNYKDCYTFIAGELFKENNEWQFRALGYGTRDTSISIAVTSYGLK